MKYDILVQTFTSVYPILYVFIFTGSKTIFAKKKKLFQPKNFRIFFLSKSVLGYYKTKKEKNWHGPLSHQGRGVKSLVVRPLKKNTFFMCVSPIFGLFLSKGTINIRKFLFGHGTWPSPLELFIIHHFFYCLEMVIEMDADFFFQI